MSKKLQEKQAKKLAEQAKRAEQQRAHRRSNLITALVAAVVLIGVGLLIFNDRQSNGGVTAPEGVAASGAGCNEIQDFETEGNSHVDDGTQVDYETNPPTSGDHYPVPADPDFYADPLPPEQLVHNQEHGQIVFWYNPGAPQSLKDDLETLVEAINEDTAATAQPPLIATPYADLPAEFNFAMSAWTHSQSCAEYSKGVVDEFRSRFQGRGRESVGVPTFAG